MTADCFLAPVEKVIEYETRPVDGLAEGSIYSGYPRPESESAWKNLMDGKSNLVSKRKRNK
jgi:hypothetical protein